MAVRDNPIWPLQTRNLFVAASCIAVLGLRRTGGVLAPAGRVAEPELVVVARDGHAARPGG